MWYNNTPSQSYILSTILLLFRDESIVNTTDSLTRINFKSLNVKTDSSIVGALITQKMRPYNFWTRVPSDKSWATTCYERPPCCLLVHSTVGNRQRYGRVMTCRLPAVTWHQRAVGSFSTSKKRQDDAGTRKTQGGIWGVLYCKFFKTHQSLVIQLSTKSILEISHF